ncbi:hypothetical protein [Rhizobium leguminosarum]|uniref:hypothetical protein n=1 Tax=Rhizobium TaxID=379 RepID=UPI00140FEA23|nr:hypothetical protein [Rhizobium leguminosarum]QIO67479.1 hypothetical protein HA462_21365 [Rhizobium leguminosarum bv. trifolii]
MIFLFDPADLSQYSGLSPDNQRDWRRRGFLDGVGELQSNGRWKYSAINVIRIAVAKTLVSRRLVTDIADAIHIAGRVASYVWFRLSAPSKTPDKIEDHYRQIRYVVAFGAMEEGDQIQIEVFEKLESVGKFRLGALLVVDCHILADELAEILRPAIAMHVNAMIMRDSI